MNNIKNIKFKPTLNSKIKSKSIKKAENKRLFSEFNFDMDDFRVGDAVNPKGPTGCTVFHFDRCKAHAVADIRGGAAATRETSLLGGLSESNGIDALVFSGGSTYGLAAADGVMKALLKLKKNSVKFIDIPCVPSAVIYDFSGRKNSIYPDSKLGEDAFKKAKRNKMNRGRTGAGVNASVGKFFGRDEAEPGGQGADYLKLKKAKFFAFSVVNSLGNILDLNGNIIRGSILNQKIRPADRLIQREKQSVESRGNTTISVAITNIDFNRNELQRIAALAHTAMARVIDPFHTSYDGDVLFVVSTRKISVSDAKITENEAGILLGSLLQNAVISIWDYLRE